MAAIFMSGRRFPATDAQSVNAQSHTFPVAGGAALWCNAAGVCKQAGRPERAVHGRDGEGAGHVEEADKVWRRWSRCAGGGEVGRHVEEADKVWNRWSRCGGGGEGARQ
eukprot:360599-Chlamydomonas_euryale.AAC.3